MGGMAIAGFGMGGGAKAGAAPAGAGAAGAAGGLAGARMVLVEIMRVNSPGPESARGAGGAAAAADVSTSGAVFTPSESLWINRVTLPASGADGAAAGAGVYDGSGAEENEGDAAGE